MPIKFELRSEKSRAKKLRGRLPSKRTINLATVNVKRINWLIAIPLILLILTGAAALSKYAVIDRYAAVDVARADIALLQQQLNEGYEQIESFGTINERYAHYSYADMTDEEMARVDRIEVFRLLRSVVMPAVEVEAWTLNENLLTLNIDAPRLQDINDLMQRMLKDPLVDYCAVLDAVLETELSGVQLRIAQLTRMREEIVDLDTDSRFTRMASYNDLDVELALLNRVLIPTQQYSISFQNLTRDGDMIRRSFMLQFTVDSVNAAQTVIEGLTYGGRRCLVGDVSCSINEDSEGETSVNVGVLATFYETMADGEADIGLFTAEAVS